MWALVVCLAVCMIHAKTLIFIFSPILLSRAGRSPKFQDPGTPLNGLSGTRQSDGADPRVSHGLAGTRVPGYPIPALLLRIYE